MRDNCVDPDAPRKNAPRKMLPKTKCSPEKNAPRKKCSTEIFFSFLDRSSPDKVGVRYIGTSIRLGLVRLG